MIQYIITQLLNYINQLLKLSLSKHTYTHTKVIIKKKIIIIKKGNANLPSQGKSIPTTPQMEVPTPTIKESDP